MPDSHPDPNTKLTQAKFNDAEIRVGTGGEVHQVVGGKSPVMTTQLGHPIADGQNQLKVGARGPTVLNDAVYREKMFHFDHERIPERVVHARGYGAHGYFETTRAIPELTRADIFQRVGEKTPAFVRFSTVAGSAGSMDVARDVRGFAVKMYTREGNWDVVGNNIPVFFIQDAIKFPDLIHSVKPEPDRGFPQAQSAHDNFWDYISLSPETIHMTLWTMSDRAIPRSFRFMEGFGVHTFRMINADGKSTYVKFHWKPKLGLQSVVWNEAVKINGADPDYHRRDLWEAIEAGNYPEWELGLQVFDDAFAEKFAFDVLDATKLIPEEEVPVQVVGRLVLDRAVDNFFAETEQVAFNTTNLPPGIDSSNDPLLQGRNFSYLDTQLKRLGSTNFTYLPINAPKCPFLNFQQDGHMATRNPKGRANYEPNSWSDNPGPRESPSHGYQAYPAHEEGPVRRARSETFADHYSQARQFYISQTPSEQKHIAEAYTFELSKVQTPAIRARVVSHLLNVDKGLAKAVADGLRLKEMPAPAQAARPTRTDLPPSPKLSIVLNGPKEFRGRVVGALVTDGVDVAALTAVKKAVEAEGSTLKLIAPHVGGVKASDGTWFDAHEQLDGGPSVLYDAVVLLPSGAEVAKLAAMPPARDFVADAVAHRKFIGYGDSALPLLLAVAGASATADQGFIALDRPESAVGFVASCRKLRCWQRTVGA